MALAVLILRRREPNSNRPLVAPLGNCHLVTYQHNVINVSFNLVCVYVFLFFTTYALVFVFIPLENKYYPYWRKKSLVAQSSTWLYSMLKRI